VSTIIYNEEQKRMMTFGEFCLSESIAPKSVAYGTDIEMNDKTFYVSSDDDLATFFEFNKLFYCVTYIARNKEVGFGVSEKQSVDMSDYSDTKIQTSKALQVFGHVMFIIMTMANEQRLDVIKFDSANTKLGEIYDRLVNNKFIMKYINDKHFEYTGKEGKVHVFKRK
jgi:hypothetical protein